MMHKRMQKGFRLWQESGRQIAQGKGWVLLPAEFKKEHISGRNPS